MHLGIDVREVCRTRRTGKGMWTMRFVGVLLERRCSMTLFTDAPLPDAWQRLHETHPQCMRVVTLPRGLLWHFRVTRFLLRDATIEAYISPVSYLVPFLIGRRVRTVLIIHDLIAWLDPTHDKRAAFIERRTLSRALKCAWRICTVSHTTKHDLSQRFPFVSAQRIHVLGAASIDDLAEPAVSDGRTILSIGTLCPRKNQLRLIDAYSMLPENIRTHCRLVLVGGRGWRDDAIVRAASRTPGVEWMGYLSDDAMRALLSRAAIVAYPSHYEGFGLPILDAMRCGIPVLCSHHGSLAEVAGDAALIVDPNDVVALRNGLLRLLTDSTLRAQLTQRGRARAAQCTWAAVADRFERALYA